VINIGSVNAYVGGPNLLVYSATKGALMTASRNMANALQSTRVRVFCLNVGWMDSDGERAVLAEEGMPPDFIEREGKKLLIGGDTAATASFQAHRRHGPFEAAIMPIGAYDPWIRNHCTPEQAVRMADAAGARLFVPVHHQTFELSREPFLEPIERTEAALAAERGRLALREIGETVVFA